MVSDEQLSTRYNSNDAQLESKERQPSAPLSSLEDPAQQFEAALQRMDKLMQALDPTHPDPKYAELGGDVLADVSDEVNDLRTQMESSMYLDFENLSAQANTAIDRIEATLAILVQAEIELIVDFPDAEPIIVTAEAEPASHALRPTKSAAPSADAPHTAETTPQASTISDIITPEYNWVSKVIQKHLQGKDGEALRAALASTYGITNTPDAAKDPSGLAFVKKLFTSPNEDIAALNKMVVNLGDAVKIGVDGKIQVEATGKAPTAPDTSLPSESAASPDQKPKGDGAPPVPPEGRVLTGTPATGASADTSGAPEGTIHMEQTVTLSPDASEAPPSTDQAATAPSAALDAVDAAPAAPESQERSGESPKVRAILDELATRFPEVEVPHCTVTVTESLEPNKLRVEVDATIVIRGEVIHLPMAVNEHVNPNEAIQNTRGIVVREVQRQYNAVRERDREAGRQKLGIDKPYPIVREFFEKTFWTDSQSNLFRLDEVNAERRQPAEAKNASSTQLVPSPEPHDLSDVQETVAVVQAPDNSYLTQVTLKLQLTVSGRRITLEQMGQGPDRDKARTEAQKALLTQFQTEYGKAISNPSSTVPQKDRLTSIKESIKTFPDGVEFKVWNQDELKSISCSLRNGVLTIGNKRFSVAYKGGQGSSGLFYIADKPKVPNRGYTHGDLKGTKYWIERRKNPNAPEVAPKPEDAQESNFWVHSFERDHDFGGAIGMTPEGLELIVRNVLQAPDSAAFNTSYKVFPARWLTGTGQFEVRSLDTTTPSIISRSAR